MTLAGRSTTLHLALFGAVAVAALTGAAVWAGYQGMFGEPIPPMSVDQLLAAGAAVVAGAISLVGGAVYTRMFRRSTSLSVFFVTFSLILSVLDVTKLLQLVLVVTPWPQLSPAVSRVSILGHLAGVLALFTAGLYAGGVRMQRHGTAIVVGLGLTAALSWAIPIDVSDLPDHLVHETGIRSSLEAAVFVLLGAAVLNYVQAAIVNRDNRQLFGALAVALIATGREFLYYLTMPIALLIGAIAMTLGVILFAARNYRDSLIR